MRGGYRLMALALLLGGCKQHGNRPAPVPPGPEAPHVLGATAREPAPDAAVATRAVDAGPPLPGPDSDAAKARAKAMANARNAGILGALKGPKGAFASIAGTGSIASGLDDKDINGGLTGTQMGDVNGVGGLGSTGWGTGGGGTGTGSIGLGNVGTLGRGSGAGTGYGIGPGGGSRGSHSGGPSLSLGGLSGASDVDEVSMRRILRMHQSAFVFCYSKRLAAQPQLVGTVVVSFTVALSGAVSGVKASGVDPEVASCVKSVVEGSQFPRPSGGQELRLTIPLTFRPIT